MGINMRTEVTDSSQTLINLLTLREKKKTDRKVLEEEITKNNNFITTLLQELFTPLALEKKTGFSIIVKDDIITIKFTHVIQIPKENKLSVKNIHFSSNINSIHKIRRDGRAAIEAALKSTGEIIDIYKMTLGGIKSTYIQEPIVTVQIDTKNRYF